MKLHQASATSRSTPGTRRTWSTVPEWVLHLRDLVRKQGTRGRYAVDLEAHLVACDLAFLRSRTRRELEQLRGVLNVPELRARILPRRGHRAGSPGELIVNEVHNGLERLRMADARRERRAREVFAREVRVMQLRLPFEAAAAERRAA